MIDTAREIIAANGYANRVVFHEARSVDVELDVRVDLIRFEGEREAPEHVGELAERYGR